MPSHVAPPVQESRTVSHGTKLRVTSHVAKVGKETGYYTLIEGECQAMSSRGSGTVYHYPNESMHCPGVPGKTTAGGIKAFGTKPNGGKPEMQSRTGVIDLTEAGLRVVRGRCRDLLRPGGNLQALCSINNPWCCLVDALQPSLITPA
jgi:hypothetical protein